MKVMKTSGLLQKTYFICKEDFFIFFNDTFPFESNGLDRISCVFTWVLFSLTLIILFGGITGKPSRGICGNFNTGKVS